MIFKPRHVLIGELGSDSFLQEAQDYYPHHCSWVVPKGAKQGDSVVVLIGKKFVADAVIREDAKPTDTSGEYHSTLGAIKVWGDLDVRLHDVKEQMPEWKYLTYPRNYTSVPAEFQEPLLAALHQAMEWAEQRLDGQTPPPPVPRKLEEVISVPCGTSIHISEATGVHACPDEFPWSSYRPTRYMALRHPGGLMKRVYRVEHMIILPRLADDLALVPEEYRARVAAYIERRRREWNFTGKNFKFYILSLDDTIELPHLPRPKHALQGHCYFWLSDLRAGEKVVQVSSKSSGHAAAVKLKTPKEVFAEVEAEEQRTLAANEGATPEPDIFEVGAFDPETLNDARLFQVRQIVARRGQAGFRQQLLDAYGGQCAFTGYSPTQALEAAHIMPYCGSDSDRVANGLLLRADIHTLFDQGLVAVDTSNPDKLLIVVAPALLESSYKYLSGKEVRLPNNPALRPSLKALEWHRKGTGL